MGQLMIIVLVYKLLIFPNVESAAEIKQAFNELINMASQRASKNRRQY